MRLCGTEASTKILRVTTSVHISQSHPLTHLTNLRTHAGTIGERSKKKRRRTDTSYTIVFDDGTIEASVLEEHVRPTRPLSGLYEMSCVDASSSDESTKLRFELNFLSTGEIQGIGHRCEQQQESMDDTLLNGNWWRDVMKCRVRVDFSWNDMTFRGYMNGLGESSGSWYDKGDEDCVRSVRSPFFSFT